MFFRRPILITIILQIGGPILFGFGDWANVILYLSGFGMAYAVYQYETHHKKQLEALLQHIKEGP